MNAFFEKRTGGDMVFIETAKRMRGFRKVVVTSELGKECCLENGLKAEFLVTTNETVFRNVIKTYLVRIFKALALKLKIKKGDILIGTSDFLPDILPSFLLKIKERKVFWIQHIFHLIPRTRKISYLSQRISLFLIRLSADVVIVDNSLLEKELLRFGFKEDKVIVNYPGIPSEVLSKIKKSEKKYEAVFMAQLRSQKGIFDLVKIWKIIFRKYKKAKLAIIGSSDKRMVSELRRKIFSVGLFDNVKLLGYLPNDEAYKTIKSAKIFIFPSYEEGFGITPLEAQKLGLPVVAWHLPVYDEVFKKGMIKVRVGDLKEFAKKVEELLGNKKFYQKIADEAKENAGNYDWEKTAKGELNVILNCLKKTDL